MAAEARFQISLEGNAETASTAAADAMAKLRDAILGSQSRVQSFNSELRRLKGSSDEVAAAKNELKAKINAEQAAITAATLGLARHGTTLKEVSDALRKTSASEGTLVSEAQKASSVLKTVSKAANDNGTAHDRGASGVARAVDALRGLDVVGRGAFRRMNELKESVSGAGGAVGIAAIGLIGLAAAVVKVTEAAVQGAVAFGKWIIESANAQRSMLLFEQGALGTSRGMLASAQSAQNFAAQIDDLAGRVPQARDELAALGNELAGKGLRGQPLVDAMNAIAQTASAKGQAAGDLLKAQLEASLGGGAAAARKMAEAQFSAINADKLLDLNVQANRFKENMVAMTRDINLTPLLTAIASITGFFSADSVTGAAIKQIVTAIGNQLGKWAEAAAPFIKNAMKQLLILGLEAGIMFLQLYHRVRDAFGPDTTSSVDLLNVALSGLKGLLDITIGGVIGAYAVWRVLAAALHEVMSAVKAVEDAFSSAKAFLSQGWSDIGKQIIDGLVSGITGGVSAVANAVSGVATKAKDTFKGLLGIHSPSTVFADMGQNTTAGFAQGVDSGGDQVRAATRGLAADATAGVASIAPSRALSAPLSQVASSVAPATASPVASIANAIAPPAALSKPFVVPPSPVPPPAIPAQAAPGPSPLAKVAAAVAPPPPALPAVAAAPSTPATPSAPMAVPSSAHAATPANAKGGASVTVNVSINVDGAGGKGTDVAKQVTQQSVLDQITKAVEDALATVGMVPVSG